MDDGNKKRITVYHGTTIEDAGKILSGIKPSKGYGEFGQGFYTVFSQQQAFHIAQYYWDSEKRYLQGKTGVAIVSIEILTEDWEAWIAQKEILCYQTDAALPGIPLPAQMQKWSPDEYAQDEDKGKDRGLAVIIGPIKDRATPYLQAVFGSQARGGLKRAKIAMIYSLKTQTIIGRSEYPSAEAREEKGTLNQLLSADDVVAKFKASAAEYKSQAARMEFVTQVFGGFNTKDLPDGREGRALVKFLKENGLQTTETSPDGAIYDYIQKGLAK